MDKATRIKVAGKIITLILFANNRISRCRGEDIEGWWIGIFFGNDNMVHALIANIEPRGASRKEQEFLARRAINRHLKKEDRLIENGVVKCDFCDAEVSEKDYLAGLGKFSWGQRGILAPGGPCCMLQPKQKHACSKDLCQAKLLVWTRS